MSQPNRSASARLAVLRRAVARRAPPRSALSRHARSDPHASGPPRGAPARSRAGRLRTSSWWERPGFHQPSQTARATAHHALDLASHRPPQEHGNLSGEAGYVEWLSNDTGDRDAAKTLAVLQPVVCRQQEDRE